MRLASTCGQRLHIRALRPAGKHDTTSPHPDRAGRFQSGTADVGAPSDLATLIQFGDERIETPTPLGPTCSGWVWGHFCR